MKANEAPEKIYLVIDPVWGSMSVNYNRNDTNNIEYVRKDAFIEKTFEFFGEHLWEYIDVKNANCDTFVNIDGDKLKEDFRKYMGGE